MQVPTLFSCSGDYPSSWLSASSSILNQIDIVIKNQIELSIIQMLVRHPKDKKILCKIHNNPAIQLGYCLTCSNKAPICETKGCIGFHQQNERAHNIMTLEHIRHIVSQYINSNIQKRAYLKKMVHEYFTIARKEVERLFTEVYQSIDIFVFDDLIFHEDDRILIDKLKEQEYETLTCEQVALIIPKLIKSTDFEDGHFTHLRNYLISEKEKVQNMLNSVLLNLPEFRWKRQEDNAYVFHEIAEQTLKDVNTMLINMTNRPKKLRIKYGTSHLMQWMQGLHHLGFGIDSDIKSFEGQKNQFVRMIRDLGTLNDMEAFQIYCVWEIDENQFQILLIEALLKRQYLKEISIYTSYRVTSTEFLEELAETRTDVQIKIFKKDWAF